MIDKETEIRIAGEGISEGKGMDYEQAKAQALAEWDALSDEEKLKRWGLHGQGNKKAAKKRKAKRKAARQARKKGRS